MSSSNSDRFTSFSVWILFIFFLLLWLPRLGLPKLWWIIVARVDTFVSDLRENAFSFSPLRVIWLWVCHIWPLIHWGRFPLCPLSAEFLSCMGVEFFQKLFLHLLRWSYGFYSLLIWVYHTDWFPFLDCGFLSTGSRAVHLASGVCLLGEEADLRGLCRLSGESGCFLPTGGWSCVKGWVFRGGYGLRWGCVPIDCLAWGVLALEPGQKRWLLGELNSHLWVLSRMSASSICDPTVTSHLPRDALRPAGKSGPGSYEVTGFSLGWECTRPGVHLQEWSFCSPPSGRVLWRQPCWPSKPHAVGAPPDTSPPGWGVRCGAPHSLLWENLCDTVIFQLVVSHLVGTGFDVIAAAVSLLPSYLGFSFVFGYRVSLIGSF